MNSNHMEDAAIGCAVLMLALTVLVFVIGFMVWGLVKL